MTMAIFSVRMRNKKPGAYEASKSNADVTWEKSVKQNYGIDFSILNEKLNISLDYFKRKPSRYSFFSRLYAGNFGYGFTYYECW